MSFLSVCMCFDIKIIHNEIPIEISSLISVFDKPYHVFHGETTSKRNNHLFKNGSHKTIFLEHLI